MCASGEGRIVALNGPRNRYTIVYFVMELVGNRPLAIHSVASHMKISHSVSKWINLWKHEARVCAFLVILLRFADAWGSLAQLLKKNKTKGDAWDARAWGDGRFLHHERVDLKPLKELPFARDRQWPITDAFSYCVTFASCHESRVEKLDSRNCIARSFSFLNFWKCTKRPD